MNGSKPPAPGQDTGSVSALRMGPRGLADLSALIAQGGAFSAIQTDFGAFRLIEHGRSLAWRDAEGDDVDLWANALRQMIQEDRAAAE